MVSIGGALAKSAIPPDLVILIDDREKLAWKFPDEVSTECVHMPVGDYSCKTLTDTAVLERKGLDDLIGSLTYHRERFIEECKLLQSYPVRAICVEASLGHVLDHRYSSKTNPQSIVGSAVALMCDFQIPMLWLEDAPTAANFALRLFIRLLNRAQQQAKSEERAA